MKTPLLITLTLLLGTSAFAKSAPHKAKASAKSISLTELKQTAQDLSDTLANADGCQFDVKENRDGITLSVRDSKNATAYLDVTESNSISVEDLNESGADGSFNRVFTVNGAGSIRVIHADDAFESVEVTDRDGHSISCELDI